MVCSRLGTLIAEAFTDFSIRRRRFALLAALLKEASN
jgi:hypothetical protein